jgi:two-component system sensor histidine kinase VicK
MTATAPLSGADAKVRLASEYYVAGPSMQLKLHALIAEDSEQDAALLVRELRNGGYSLSYERVESESAMAAALARQHWDIVLTDYSMPQFNAARALALIAKSGIDTPCIVVSGAVGEETAAEVMRAGAHDLVLKHNLRRLLPAIRREIDAARIRRERKAADAELDRERQLLKQLMQGMPDAICFKDVERRYIRLNGSERAVLNIASDADAIGKTVDELTAPGLASKRRADEERVLATGEALLDCVEKIDGPRGSIRWLSATKAPIRDSQDEIVGMVEITRDITESKRQEQLKDEFIATVSHELRTPVTSIFGSVGCLVGGAAGALPDPALRVLRIALNNCQRLVGIVNDILDIDRIEAGKILYKREAVDVRALAVQVIDANQSFADSFGVAVRLDDAADEGTVDADPQRLAQVLTNLLSNAIKFSPRGSEVVISVETRNQIVSISVRDHGPGVPDDYRDHIFEKFVQVDASDRRQRGGTGLGLTIAKQIVDQLDGQIRLEPAEGGGTIFTVAFKARTETPHYDDRANNDAATPANAKLFRQSTERKSA